MFRQNCLLQKTRINSFIFFIVTFSAISCGKSLETNIENEVVSRTALKDSSIVLQSTLSINGNKHKDHFLFNENALVRIPTFIEVKQGNAANQWARINFNQRNEQEEFFCTYKGGAFSETPDSESDLARGMTYHFYGCYQDVDGDGSYDELNYYPGLESIQDRDHKISLEILSADPRFDISGETLLEIEWH